MHHVLHVVYEILDRFLRHHMTLTMSSTKFLVMHPFTSAPAFSMAAALYPSFRLFRLHPVAAMRTA